VTCVGGSSRGGLGRILLDEGVEGGFGGGVGGLWRRGVGRGYEAVE